MKMKVVVVMVTAAAKGSRRRRTGEMVRGEDQAEAGEMRIEVKQEEQARKEEKNHSSC